MEWLEKRLSQPGLFIITNSTHQSRYGYVDVDPDDLDLSIGIVREKRGKGYAKAVIRYLGERLLLKAWVWHENLASLRAFRGAGWVEEIQGDRSTFLSLPSPLTTLPIVDILMDSNPLARAMDGPSCQISPVEAPTSQQD
jgi:RimJ/RimL family protein N-acetyltransferase